MSKRYEQIFLRSIITSITLFLLKMRYRSFHHPKRGATIIAFLLGNGCFSRKNTGQLFFVSEREGVG